MEKTHYVWPNLRAGSYELIMHVNASLYRNNLRLFYMRDLTFSQIYLLIYFY